MQTRHAKGVVDAQGNLQIEAMPLLAGGETVDVIVYPAHSTGAAHCRLQADLGARFQEA